MDRAELLEHLTEDILAYVMHGAFPENDLAAALKPDALDERFTEYELLLNLHFILTPELIEFVETLPRRVRTLNTETESVARRRRGTIDGKINWAATIKQRYAQNPGDRSVFVCENRTEDYDTAENLVFKRLIAIIYDTLREAEEYLRKDYAWVNERWNAPLINNLRRIVEQNVHVRRIRDPHAYEPTDRMLNTASESRHEIYRDAASLLKTHRKLFAGDREQLTSLLAETAITPDDDETLLELFVLFRCIATLEALQDTTTQFETIKTDRQEIARLEGQDESEIVVYHDNSARDRNLSFRPVPDESKRHLSRTEKVHTTGAAVANDYFTNRDLRTHTGRPDLIVIEIKHTADDRDYLITEVKNSTNRKTIQQGIKETLEYLAFLRDDGSFVYGDEAHNEDYFGDGWNGLLVIQDLAEETAALDEQDGQMKILQASELESQLSDVLAQLL
ncbi:hypothetical protein SAMN04487948_1205 [Halogranum amylolyticum]|uniref:Uncharacterized protein n=1 Tax=Halogranum amylolyticum TaxID=660520 RepID=A0A1H8VVJ8_9EURY|nr:hypothetical protein [Halogranum amylolyticum]SEP19303.1 hypothetical protein SAMN04487948_1205 [Halogranum amylolyticum]